MYVLPYCSKHNAIGPFGHVSKMAASQNVGASDLNTTAKRLKTVENDGGNDGEAAAERCISGFEVGRILRDSAREKNIFLHGKVRTEKSVS